jgi:serine/threonine protein kinase
VNLTCGRNPWKQASFEDSTYRAFTRSSDFLKTILPLSDELNDILCRIFERNPDQRITLAELRNSILACSHFTIPATATTAQALRTPPASPEQANYVNCEDAIVDDFSYDAPLSPASTDSDGESTCSSDDGSLTSSCSTIDDLDEEDFAQDDLSPKDHPRMYDPEDASMFYPQDFVPQHQQPQQYPPASLVESCQPCQPPSVASAPPIQAPYANKFFQFPPVVWDMMNRYVQHPIPVQHHAGHYHHPQMPMMPAFQGCY